YREFYAGAAKTYGRDPTFMETFSKSDEYAGERKSNLYYPFASAEEWELAAWLNRTKLSVAEIEEFLKLRLTANMHLSFTSAKDLRSRIETLPAGPQWKAVPWKTHFATKKPLTLYYRDPLECLEALLANPLIQDFIHFTPFRLWKTAEKLTRVYTEWLSGNVAWNIQSQLPPGATVLGTVLSTDKTQLTSMTGNRQAYPVLISLADLDMEFRAKASHHAFMLFALLPIAKFYEKDKEIVGVLTSRVFHAIMDFILKPLKKVAEIGQMMRDPLGYRRAHTITLLKKLEEDMGLHPWDDIFKYVKEAKKLGLNGVHRPFWRDWPLAEPSQFLTPEPLHHWMKMFWDHVCKWCILALGAAEIDFRFSVLRPHTGMRHFKEGISKAKQTTGREHRDIQRYIVPVIAGAVSKKFLASVASLDNFFYEGQAPSIDEDYLRAKITGYLKQFHDNKQAILAAGVRKGKAGPINNWHIPKLEFLQTVPDSIRDNGVPIQWSADITERAHIDLVKDPASNSNNQNHETQICRHLDRLDKCRNFDLVTAMASAGIDFGAPEDPTNEAGDDEEQPLLLNSTSALLAQIDPVSRLSGTSRAIPNLFLESSLLAEGRFPTAPQPFRTFCSSDGQTAFHLGRDHVGRQLTVKEAADKFRLPDFQAALAAYLNKTPGTHLHSQISIGGGKRTGLQTDSVRFEKIEFWSNVRIQNRSFHNRDKILEPQTVNAAPPDAVWKCGRADAVLVNKDLHCQWPRSGLEGHTVAQLRMIFRVVPRANYAPLPGTEGFLAYVERFDIIQQVDPATGTKGPDPASGMYAVRRARRSEKFTEGSSKGPPMGDVVPLGRLRVHVELTPQFGKKADHCLKKETSLDHWDDFWLCKWFNKDLFYALSQ
ncbi:hypothetical protein B0H12DRAFT_1034874, partial [Mycena haematopus]